MIRTLRKPLYGFTLACALTPGAIMRAQVTQMTPSKEIRIVEPVDESLLVQLKGSTVSSARPFLDRGTVAPGLAMGDLFLVLRRSPEMQAAFNQFVTSQYDPASPNFHQWLGAVQIGETFGPAPEDIRIICTWLQNHGFTIEEVSKDRVSIRFSGTATQVQAGFHTEIHNLDVKGQPYIGNLVNAQIPAALAPVVLGVRGLSNFFPQPLHRLGGRVTRNAESGHWQRSKLPSSAAGGMSTNFLPVTIAAPPRAQPLFDTTDAYGDVIEDVVPYDFATIYNVLPLWQASTPIDGTGQSIAIAGTSNINVADVKAFRTAFGLPTAGAANTPSIVITNSDPGDCPSFADSCSGDLVENTLDVEWSGAVAKNATIILVTSSAPTVSTDALYLSESYIVQNKTASIMNVSYGACELVLGYAGNVQYNNLWQTAASEGISVLVASGDAGSPACDQGFDAVQGVPYAAQFGLQVSGIASTPYNTAVGGTDFNWGSTAAPYWNSTSDVTTGASALGYVPETAWNSTCVNSLILPALAADATYIGASPVTDAESACNFIVENNSTIAQQFGVNLAGLVDTIGGGGGASNCTQNYSGDPSSCSDGYAKPAWQKDVVGIPSDGVRDIPDVSFFASNGFLGSSYLICVTAGGSACTYSATSEPTALEVGGTSVASPAMAGVMALVNQRTGASQGNADITLYSLASTQTYSACNAESVKSSGSCLFNDVDTGTIAMVCANGYFECDPAVAADPAGVLGGYAAGVGYDLATGLGSLNVANVVNHWPLASAPTVNLSPSSLAFASTVEGSPSATQTITLTNTGKGALAISSIGFSGTNPASFLQTNNCGSSVAANTSCAITVTFKPLIVGAVSAVLAVVDNAFDSPETVQLSGTSTAPQANAIFSATSINFGSTAVGATNPTTLQLENNGAAVLSITGISVTGTNASSFIQTNSCGSTLASGANCTINLTFKPLVAGSLSASLQAADNANGSPQMVALTGMATSSSAVTATLSATSITFPATAIGSNSATVTSTLTNSGTSALSITSKGITGNISSFTESDTCGFSVAASSSCTLSFTFKPTSSGTLSAVYSIADNATGSPQSITLSGTGGSGGTVTVSPGTLSFGSSPVGTATAAQSITIKNTGTTAITLAGNTFSGPNANSFLKSATTCSSPLAAGATCTNSIEFDPAAPGALTATLNINTSASGTAPTVTLTGTGTSAGPVVTVTPGSLSFGSSPIGSTTAAQIITIKNTGSTAITLAGNTFSGSNANSFIKSATTCSSPLAAGSSCTNSIEFDPTSAGALNATLSVNTSAPGAAPTVALNGTGTSTGSAVTVTPTSFVFATTAVGYSSAAEIITIKNTGTTPLTLAGNTFSGSGASSFSKSATTCSSPLAAGASCTNTIQFTPVSAGSFSAALSVNTSAPGPAPTVGLTGTGVAPGITVTPGSLTFSSTKVGTASAAQIVTFKNVSSSPIVLNGNTFTGVGAASFIKSATTCSSPLAAGASCTNSIELDPAVTGALAASLSVNTSAAGSPQLIPLNGTGQ
jgi:hypothetical protein